MSDSDNFVSTLLSELSTWSSELRLVWRLSSQSEAGIRGADQWEARTGDRRGKSRLPGTIGQSVDEDGAVNSLISQHYPRLGIPGVDTTLAMCTASVKSVCRKVNKVSFECELNFMAIFYALNALVKSDCVFFGSVWNCDFILSVWNILWPSFTPKNGLR